MIGIIPKASQIPVVEEFFELFKTPWELFRPGQAYDVVIATADELPEVKAKLLLVYGPTAKSIDGCHGIALSKKHEGADLSAPDLLPIYGEVVTFAGSSKGTVCVTVSGGTAGLKVTSNDSTVLRLGYDLFEEVRFLLSTGQPVEHAHIPTLDIQIRMLRDWILDEGIPLLEILPTPAGHSFVVCLTHDIDFIGIRNHKFDHSMWGFLYRSTVGAIQRLFRGRISLTRLFETWRAAASLPFVFLGWMKDFWEPFEWYLEVEKGLPATYFLIPFKRRSGERVPGTLASLRATAYDVTDLQHWTRVLLNHGCEIGVHGIDAWHRVDKGRSELARMNAATGETRTGIRIHWLLRDANTPSVLEQAGYAYDSTVGYNETIGYRAGTSEVFRPLGVQSLLEIPLHIQDGALFFPDRLDLSEPEAEKRCQVLIDNAIKCGGVLTVLWHDRSHGPERFWGDFYIKLVQTLRSLDGWFATASATVNWFSKRRDVRFERVTTPVGTRTCLRYEGEEIQPPLKVRVYGPMRRGKHGESVGKIRQFVDIPSNGKSMNELDLQVATHLSGTASDVALCSLS